MLGQVMTMSDIRFGEEVQALIDYGHDCCARVDDRIHEYCQRIREAHDEEVGIYQIALMWKKEQDANAMDAGGSVSAGCSGDDAAAAGRVDNCAGDQLAKGVAPITTELREYVQSWRETPNLMDELDAGDIDGLLGDFIAIADRIDAEYEKVMSRAGQLLDDAEKERDYNYAYWQDCKQKVLQHNITMGELSAEIERLEDELSHCIELAKDMGGEYIHEHDKVDWRDHACTWHENATVVAVCNDGCYVMDGTVFHVHKSDIRHHHDPTVEDVLRGVVTLCHNTWKEGSAFEFYDVDDVMKSGNIAEYAAKLRLVEDANA